MHGDFVVSLLSHYRELKHFLMRELRNAEDAADIAQSSFERVYAFSQNGSGGTAEETTESSRALLYKVAKNLCIDEFRHRKITVAWADQHRWLATTITPSAEYLVAYKLLVERVIRQLMHLPEKRREVFLLFRAYGYSQREIAAKLDIAEATVGKHILRASLDCARVFSELRTQIPADEFAVPDLAFVERCDD
ncbi:RNA polymerase sigma factor [Herbaspirillum chlorophenolicum]|uniref:RNA polymerase sigma factor n=1 Tax=Herbaspirillum chlorophenolicum TaxID=211589 RepID=A0ABW8EXM5_9BURK